MGHVLLGTLPATRPWKEVVALIAGDADVDAVADATIRASDEAFNLMENDAGFREAVWLLTQLAVAAKQDDPSAHHEAIGLNLSSQTSLVEVAMAVGKAIDDGTAVRGKSDFGEMAHNALVGAIVEKLNHKFGTLFSPSSTDVHSALASLGTKKEFGDLSRSFFAKLTHSCLDYFLTKTLGAHVGENRRFTTISEVTEFQSALETHCTETALIVQKYSGEWFSKGMFEGAGEVSRDKTRKFGWYAMQKIRMEIKERAKPDGARV